MKTGVIFLLAATAALFLWGAATQFQRNRDMNRTDQSAYMDYAKKSRTVPFGFVPSRNYMPMYPGVISWFYRDGDSDAEYFQRGKLVNIGIALLSLALLYGVLLRNNDRWDATVAVSAAALSMAVFKAPCFQPEMLFFAISFLMFVAQLHLVLRPSLQAAAIAGILTGFAYLTKASVPPMIALTILCLLGRSVENLLRRRAGRTALNPARPARIREIALGCGDCLLCRAARHGESVPAGQQADVRAMDLREQRLLLLVRFMDGVPGADGVRRPGTGPLQDAFV